MRIETAICVYRIRFQIISILTGMCLELQKLDRVKRWRSSSQPWSSSTNSSSNLGTVQESSSFHLLESWHSRCVLFHLPSTVLFQPLLTVLSNAKFRLDFLGLLSTNNLPGNSHNYHSLKTNIAKYFGILYKIRNHLRAETRLQIYDSFVHSHLNYCALLWGFAAESHIVFSKQKSGICWVC